MSRSKVSLLSGGGKREKRKPRENYGGKPEENRGAEQENGEKL